MATTSASRSSMRLAPLPLFSASSLAKGYASAAHAYAHDRSREDHEHHHHRHHAHEMMHAPVYRHAQQEQRTQAHREWMAPIERPSWAGRGEEGGLLRSQDEQAQETTPGGLPRLADSRTLRAWTHSLDLDAVQRTLKHADLTAAHFTGILRWARKQPPSEIPAGLHEAILGRIVALQDMGVTRQAAVYVSDALRALRKGQRPAQVISEQEARLRQMELVLGVMLDQPDLQGKAADLALRAPKHLRRGVVWPTLVTVLEHLRTAGDDEAIIELAITAFPGNPFVVNAPNESDGDAARISAVVHEAFARIENPVERLRSRHERLDHGDALAARHTRWAGLILLRSLLHRDARQREAFAIFQQVRERSEELDEDVTSSLYAWLGAVGMHAQARQVFDALEQAGPLSQQARRRAASMFASAGEAELAQKVLGPLAVQAGASERPADLLSRLHALASAGNAQGAEALAEEALPGITASGTASVASTAEQDQRLRRDVLSILLAARARSSDIEGALQYLRAILAQGGSPSLVDFNTILKIFADKRDEVSAGHLLDQMRSIGVQPDLITYSTLISLYSSRKEVEKAQEVWQEMLDARVRPDALAIGSLINAHVESGSWNGVTDIYRDLDTQIKQDPAIVNVMLKGLVLLAAPVAEVERIFQEAYPAGQGADERAWALLIQSACEADRFDIALDAYETLIRLADQPASQVKLSPHIFSILMAGYLRKNDSSSAQAVLVEMEVRGIARTSVIHGMIVKALADGKWSDRELSEEEYADQAAGQSDSAASARGSHAENVYAPLISANSRRYNVQAAEKYFRKIVAAGVQPTLQMYTALLDAYRRVGDLDGLDKTWQSLYRLATRSIASQSGDAAVSASQRNLLSIPLSIYMDALSAAGEHDKVAQVWQDVGQTGFTYDAHNWNHLVLALVKAGEIERAFQITEDVLIPRHEEVQARRIASDRASDMGKTAADLSEDALEVDPVQRPPNRRHQYRRGGRDDAAAELRDGILSRTSTAAQDQAFGTASATDNPASFNLSLFESWRPSDVVWRPSYLTIAVLDRAYSRLEKGKAVLALTSSDEEDVTDETADSAVAVDAGDAAVAAPPAQASSPLVLLGRINSRYAKTVGLIMFHRRKRRGDRSRKSS